MGLNRNLIYQSVIGLVSKIPLLGARYKRGPVGASTARYCYSVWLRHLINVCRHGKQPIPKIVGEIGPGNSLGVGYAALLSGADEYLAFDLIRYEGCENNIILFDELVSLFQTKASIPDDAELLEIKPVLSNNEFPSDILSDDYLNESLCPNRIEKIRKSIASTGHDDSVIKYIVPWINAKTDKVNFIDLIFSQAVLEHIDDLEQAYVTMNLLLKRSGVMSHQIDFRCHGTSKEWNGHWIYSDQEWRLIRGGRHFLINRYPFSAHINMLEKNEFDILLAIKDTIGSVLKVDQLAPFSRYPVDKEDLKICGAYILSQRKQ